MFDVIIDTFEMKAIILERPVEKAYPKFRHIPPPPRKAIWRVSYRTTNVNMVRLSLPFFVSIYDIFKRLIM